jgi:predicted nucleic acid-binding protein
MIISDAGPIIIFARIGRLHLLRDVTGSLLIPDAVYDEIVIKKGGMPGATEVAQAAWIQKASVTSRSIIDGLPSVLHQGEREAITLAKERGAQLLVDEIRARSAAIQFGIDVIGTLRILADAKQLKLVTIVRPIISQMQSSGIPVNWRRITSPQLRHLSRHRADERQSH